MNLSDYLTRLGEGTANPPDVEDGELENGLIQLMGRLEQMLIRLDDVKQDRHIPLTLKLAKKMLVEVLNFAESRLSQEVLTPPIARLCQVHAQTKQFERLLGDPSWNGFAQFLGFQPTYSDGTESAFEKLGGDFIELFSEFFTTFADHFNSTEKADEWKASCQVFLDDLARKW